MSLALGLCGVVSLRGWEEHKPSPLDTGQLWEGDRERNPSIKYQTAWVVSSVVHQSGEQRHASLVSAGRAWTGAGGSRGRGWGQ